MSRHVELFLGPPGTGKTRVLLDVTEQRLAAGVPPEQVAYFSFSRRAVKVAQERAKERFGYTADQLPWFRTIHSVAFKMLGLTREDVFHEPQLRDFAQRISLPMTTREQLLLDPFGGTLGDRCLLLYHLAKARCTSLEAEWQRCLLADTPWYAVRDTARYYNQYKQANGLLDFSDMLELADTPLDVDTLIVDEAQDCSTAQWTFLRRVAKGVPHVYLGGDDDQAIYGWSGADPGLLMRLEGERHVLPHSYRLPTRVKAVADALAQRIRVRVPKSWTGREADGDVRVIGDVDQLDLSSPGSWMLLARTNHQLEEFRELARRQAVIYSLPHGGWSWQLASVQAAQIYERLRKGEKVSRGDAFSLRAFTARPMVFTEEQDTTWPFGEGPRPPWFEGLERMPARDREYIRALRQRGVSLKEPGRVFIGTVHSMKGAEADHVVIVPDVTRKIEDGRRVDPDSELRVQYVAATRARETLSLVTPRSPLYWRF